MSEELNPETGKDSQLASVWSFLCSGLVTGSGVSMQGLHELAGVVSVVPSSLNKVRQGMPNITELVEDIPTTPRSTDKSDVVVVSVLSPEQRHSTGTAYGYGRKEVVVEDTLVDEMLMDARKVFTLCKGTDVLVVRNFFW